MKPTLFTIICLLTPTSSVFACLCDFDSARGQFDYSSVVFAGKVLKIRSTKAASVGIIIKEAGTLETSSNPRLERSFDKVFEVTFEVTEVFKGSAAKTLVLMTDVYKGGGCGFPFRIGESYLIFAARPGSYLDDEKTTMPRSKWTPKMIAEEAADKYNLRLPKLSTSLCSGTMHMKWAQDRIKELRTYK